MKERHWLIVLGVGLLISLTLNLVCLFILNSARQMVRESIATVRTQLRTLEANPIETQVSVDQILPISTTVNLSRTFEIPIDTVYPLSTVVHTTVEIPLLGPQDIPIPIQANLPIKLTAQVPVQMDFPISTTYHLQTELPVQVNLPSETLMQWIQWLSQVENALK
jgi:hypothetical protein